MLIDICRTNINCLKASLFCVESHFISDHAPSKDRAVKHNSEWFDTEGWPVLDQGMVTVRLFLSRLVLNLGRSAGVLGVFSSIHSVYRF